MEQFFSVNMVANGWGCVLRWGLEQRSYPPIRSIAKTD